MRRDGLMTRVDRAVSEHPGRVVVAFLLVSGVFVVGLGDVETESGQQQFTENLDAYEAYQDTQREFGSSFSTSATSTQLLQREQNVFSKPSLLRMLRVHEQVLERDGLRVTATSSPARTVAQQLDPEAGGVDAEISAVESATPSEIDAAARRAAETAGFASQVSDDFDRETVAARAMQGSVTHDRDVTDREERVEQVLTSVDGDIDIVGSGPDTISASVTLVLPAAFLLIVFFLIIVSVVVYRQHLLDLF